MSSSATARGRRSGSSDVSAYAAAGARAARGVRRRPPPTRPDALRRLRALPLARPLRGALAAARTACSTSPNITRGQVDEAGGGGHHHDGGARRRSDAPVRGMAPETLDAAGDAGPAPASAAEDRRAGLCAAPARAGQGLRPAAGAGCRATSSTTSRAIRIVEGGLEYLHGVWATDASFARSGRMTVTRRRRRS